MPDLPHDPRGAVPSLIVHDGNRALDFYRDAFGAVETLRLTYPDGRIAHAELRIGEAMIMLADEHPDLGYVSPQALGGSPVTLMLYVGDTDAAVERAVAAGATVRRAPRDEFYGERVGAILDPFGHAWTLASRIEEVSNAEVRRRFDAAMRAPADAAGGDRP